jgi:hypothetical protein
MSHIVVVKTEVRNAGAVRAAWPARAHRGAQRITAPLTENDLIKEPFTQHLEEKTQWTHPDP